MLGVCSTVHSNSVPRRGHQAAVRQPNVAVEKQATGELKTGRLFANVFFSTLHPTVLPCFLATLSRTGVESRCWSFSRLLWRVVQERLSVVIRTLRRQWCWWFSCTTSGRQDFFFYFECPLKLCSSQCGLSCDNCTVLFLYFILF